MRKLLLIVLLLTAVLMVSAQVPQGQQVVAGPFPNPGLLYVCPVPSGGTPCPSRSAIFADAALTQPLSNPISAPAQTFITFYAAVGQYTLEMPASGVQQLISVGGGGSGGGISSTAFNVKTFGGSKGNWQESDNGTVSGATPNVQTCGNCNFTQADVGKEICGALIYVTQLPCTTIDVVNSGTSVHTVGASTGTNSGVTFAWGTPDEGPVLASLNAAMAASKSIASTGNLGVITNAPQIYFPAGVYGLCTQGIQNNVTTMAGFGVIGDGIDQTKIIGLTGCNFGSGQRAMLDIGGNVTNTRLEEFTLDGMNGAQTTTFNAAALLNGTQQWVRHVRIQRFSLSGAVIQGSIFADYLFTINNNSPGRICSQCNGEFHNSVSSNNGNSANVQMINVGGAPFGSGVREWGGLVDECGTTLTGCYQLINTYDWWCIGCALFATGGGNGLLVDGNSVGHLLGGVVGPFNVDVNSGGANIANGGYLSASDVRFYSTGTGHCITNNGRFIDNGSNKCAVQQPISSSTEAANTVTLTMNATCGFTAGQEVEVLGHSIAGYNGVYTVVTGCSGGSTFTYTNPASGLANGGATGFVAGNGSTSFSGNAPQGVTYLTITHQAIGGTNADIVASTACVTNTLAVTFAKPYINTPVIIVSDETTAGGARVSAKSNTGFTVTCTGATDVFSYQVFANPN